MSLYDHQCMSNRELSVHITCEYGILCVGNVLYAVCYEFNLVL